MSSDTTLSLSISGNTTLTSTQATNGGYEFSGTLTAKATITWPSYAGFAMIQNNTNGGFGISCGISGGAFVSVPSGQTVAIWSDSSNFLQVALASGGPSNPTGNYIYFGAGPDDRGIAGFMFFQRGTASNPQATANGDELGGIPCYGWDGSSFDQQFPSEWLFLATENWTSTAHGCITVIQATPNGANNGRDELYVGGGVVVPNAVNQRTQSYGKGWGTINALSGVYDNGNRVYSASNGAIIPMSFSGGLTPQGPGTTAYYGGGPYSGGNTGSALVLPIGGTLGNLYVSFSNGPGASQSYAATLQYNNGTTGISATASGGTGFTTISDTTHTFTANAGSAVWLQVVTSAGAASIAGLTWGFTITR